MDVQSIREMGAMETFASLTALSRLLPSVIRLRKIMTSILLVHSLYCMFGLHVLIKQAAMLERPTWQGSGGGLQRAGQQPAK